MHATSGPSNGGQSLSRRTFLRGAGHLAVTPLAAGSVLATPDRRNEVFELPDDDQSNIERYLGTGVIGTPLPAPVIDNPARYLRAAGPARFVARQVYGKDAGTLVDATISPLEADSGGRNWRLDSGRHVWFGTANAHGDFIQSASLDQERGVRTRFTPGQPILLRGMQPGQTLPLQVGVEVYQAERPNEVAHSGTLELDYSYVGAYQVTVPAGTFDAVLFRWLYRGRVGPARIQDQAYWFFARDVGPVARVMRRNVSVLLVYRDITRSAAVLVADSGPGA